MLAFKDGLRVRLISRQGVDHTERFRELAHAIAALKAPTLVLDGEVCVFDKNLVSQFHLLDRGVTDEPCTPPVFMAFDCLHVHGLDVRGLPLHRRRDMLEQEVAGASMIFSARRLPDNGLAAWAVVKERGYEGLVAKDAESVYRGGPTRS
jgi:bifunctional non-homologous end joining protein LigD